MTVYGKFAIFVAKITSIFRLLNENFDIRLKIYSMLLIKCITKNHRKIFLYSEFIIFLPFAEIFQQATVLRLIRRNIYETVL